MAGGEGLCGGEEEREAARRAAQEEQQRIQEQYRRLMQRQRQLESQVAVIMPFLMNSHKVLCIRIYMYGRVCINCTSSYCSLLSQIWSSTVVVS